MDWDVIAPMITAIVLILVTGGVVLLRPLSHRLGALLEAMTEEKQHRPAVEGELDRIRATLESIESRLDLLEERQDFTEELLSRSPERDELPRGPADGDAEGG